MSATSIGGKKAAAINKLRYGNDFYKTIGRKGGTVSRGGGFSNMSPEKLLEVSRRGGSASRRGRVE